MQEFLKSFENQKLTINEKKVLKSSRRIFYAFITNMGFMMLTDSVYTLMQPYSWIDTTVGISFKFSLDYDIIIQVFYVSNTAFALILLFAVRFF